MVCRTRQLVAGEWFRHPYWQAPLLAGTKLQSNNHNDNDDTHQSCGAFPTSSRVCTGTTRPPALHRRSSLPPPTHTHPVRRCG